MYIFREFLFQNLLNDSARRAQYAVHVLFSHLTVEKEFFYSCQRNLLQIGNVDQEVSLLVISNPFSSKAMCFRAHIFSTYS